MYSTSSLVFIIGIIIIGIILLTIFKKKSKKEKFDSSVDCIRFPFLCSTHGNRITNQYSNFGLLHSSLNIKKAS
jgi:hypothetical protein